MSRNIRSGELATATAGTTPHYTATTPPTLCRREGTGCKNVKNYPTLCCVDLDAASGHMVA